jgi:hypothetical protein
VWCKRGPDTLFFQKKKIFFGGACYLYLLVYIQQGRKRTPEGRGEGPPPPRLLVIEAIGIAFVVHAVEAVGAGFVFTCCWTMSTICPRRAAASQGGAQGGDRPRPSDFFGVERARRYGSYLNGELPPIGSRTSGSPNLLISVCVLACCGLWIHGHHLFL